MCEAHIQDAPDDIPQSESDVVTPVEKEKQARKPTPEACRQVVWRKVGVGGEKPIVACQ